MWTDIAAIVFICVSANHMGLVRAAEGVLGKELPVINCPKCLTFWLTLAYTLLSLSLACDGIAPLVKGGVRGVALSFLASYTAVWLELFEGFIDTLFNRLYAKIYPTAGAADDDKART